MSFFTTADDWKCDQIHWRHYGRKKLKTDPVIMKSYFVFVDGEGRECKLFKRSAYTMKQGACTQTLVHYKGDASVAAKSKPYIRNCPSVLRGLETSTGSPSVIYKTKIAKSSESPLS